MARGGFKGDFTAPISVTDRVVGVEHTVKYVCRECGVASSHLVDGVCWRHRPIDPKDQPFTLREEPHA